MGTRYGMLLGLAAAAGMLNGCAGSKQKHFADVQRSVEERTGYQIRWYQGRPEDLAVEERIRAELERPLELRTAIQIALLHNPVLQSQFEEIGVAQSDLVQAGLLRNPTLWGRTRWPDFEPTKPDVEWALTQDILDLFLLPLRSKIAKMELEQAKLRLGQTVLATISDVRTAYYTLQATQQIRGIRQRLVDITSEASEQADAGRTFAPLSSVDITSLQVTYRRAQLEVARSQADVLVAHAALQQLMGLSGTVEWSIQPELPVPEPRAVPDVTLADVESLAMAKRLDLQATNFDLTTPAVHIARLGVLGSVFLIGDVEHLPNNRTIGGPALQSDIPIWNWRQGQIGSLKHQGRQGSYNVLAYQLRVQYEVRAAYARLISARSAVDTYRTTMLPQQERLTQQAQGGRGPTANLTNYLQVRQNETDVNAEYVTFLREYWVARSELERSIGTFLPAPSPGQAATTQITPEAATTRLTPPGTDTQPAPAVPQPAPGTGAD